MADFEDIAQGDNIDDFLVSLAEGVVEAQSQLNRLPVPDASGAPAYVYHLPKVEFELKLQITTQSRGSAQSDGGTGRGPQRLFKVLSPASQEEATAASLLRGTLVAAPVQGGRPPLVLSLAVDDQSRADPSVLVSLGNALGEAIQGATIELNIDRERSQQLNPGNKALAAGTKLALSLVESDAEGRARVKLLIARGEPSGHAIVLSADAAGASRTLIYRVGG